MCCDLYIKAPCAFILSLVSVCLTFAAISTSTNWYQDTEVATSFGQQVSVTWSATLYNWCLTGGYSQISTPNSTYLMPFNYTCWPLTVSNPPANPNNDVSIAALIDVIPELGSGLAALATGSRADKAALVVAIVLGILYLLISAAIWWSPKNAPYTCISITSKTLGFVWHLASWLGFVIWAGGLGKAQEDWTSTLGTNSAPTVWLLTSNTASTTGFSLAVGASFLSLVSCCFGCFIWPSEIEANSKGIKSVNGGLPVLPPGTYVIAGQQDGAQPVPVPQQGGGMMYAPAMGAGGYGYAGYPAVAGGSAAMYSNGGANYVAQPQFTTAMPPAKTQPGVEVSMVPMTPTSEPSSVNDKGVSV